MPNNRATSMLGKSLRTETQNFTIFLEKIVKFCVSEKPFEHTCCAIAGALPEFISSTAQNFVHTS
ncbi:MAG: hypothetical protein AAGI49_11805 [Bacteroidota bacterium]